MAPSNNDDDERPRPQVGHPEYAEKPVSNKKTVEYYNNPMDNISIIGGEDEIRSSVGGTMGSFSDVINNNLVAARYAAVSGVVLLTAYGLSHTPLFFRFRTVSEIPAAYFSGRRRLYGRIIRVEATESSSSSSSITNNNNHHQSTANIEVSIRHLSPVGQILPKKWFDFFIKFSPLAARLARTRQKHGAEEAKSELLRVRIAGIQSPPVSRQSYNPETVLKRLANDRVLVSCQLLARQVPIIATTTPEKLHVKEDVIPSELSPHYEEEDINATHQVAICRLRYRSAWFQLFPNDFAKTLISGGNANVSPSMFGSSSTSTSSSSSMDRIDNDDDGTQQQQTLVKIIDSSQRIQDLRSDVQYLDDLAKTELEAARKSMGMWSVPEVREMKREVIEEIEFQTKANILQKAWRWFRG